MYIKARKGTTRAGREPGRRMADLLVVDGRCSDSNTHRRKATKGPGSVCLRAWAFQPSQRSVQASPAGEFPSRNGRCPRSGLVLLPWVVSTVGPCCLGRGFQDQGVQPARKVRKWLVCQVHGRSESFGM